VRKSRLHAALNDFERALCEGNLSPFDQHITRQWIELAPRIAAGFTAANGRLFPESITLLKRELLAISDTTTRGRAALVPPAPEATQEDDRISDLAFGLILGVVVVLFSILLILAGLLHQFGAMAGVEAAEARHHPSPDWAPAWWVYLHGV